MPSCCRLRTSNGCIQKRWVRQRRLAQISKKNIENTSRRPNRKLFANVSSLCRLIAQSSAPQLVKSISSLKNFRILTIPTPLWLAREIFAEFHRFVWSPVTRFQICRWCFQVCAASNANWLAPIRTICAIKAKKFFSLFFYISNRSLRAVKWRGKKCETIR